ncbi:MULTISPECIES: hypothetical protein [unclassified Streptomyces]|uniref:hypothetical protein n=1 Tax=unclassified Streptomyces TaxID=2593676 RepID=UPI002E282BA7|nr:hypothetical protein [Streptomyces sp. NBC_01439]
MPSASTGRSRSNLHAVLPGGTLLSEVIAVTVGLSIILHGASAPSLGNRYGAWFTRKLRVEPNLRENALADYDAPP